MGYEKDLQKQLQKIKRNFVNLKIDDELYFLRLNDLILARNTQSLEIFISI